MARGDRGAGAVSGAGSRAADDGHRARRDAEAETGRQAARRAARVALDTGRDARADGVAMRLERRQGGGRAARFAHDE
eukprot:5975640-Prymnesium_polylepis.1